MKLLVWTPSCTTSYDRYKTLALVERGNCSEAMPVLNEMIHRDALDCELFKARAYCHSLMEDFDKELLDLEQAVMLRCADEAIYINLGDVYFRTGRYGLAAKAFENALGLNLNSAVTMSNLGVTYSFLSDHEKAVMYLSRAIALEPGNSVHHYKLGTHLQMADSPLLALPHLNRAIELDSLDPILYVKRGAIYGDLGEHDLSLRDLDRALSLEPQDDIVEEALQLKIICLVALDREREACTVFGILRHMNAEWDQSDFALDCANAFKTEKQDVYRE